MPFGHKAGLPPSKKYLLMRQPLLSSDQRSDTIAIWHVFHGNRPEKYMLFISFKSYRKPLLSLRLLVAAMHGEGIHIIIL